MMSEAKDRVRTTSAPPPGSPPPPPLDLTGPMQSWADKYGLKLEQVQSAVNQWAKQVLSQKQKDDEQVCLAHYSQGQFEQAATCFDALGQDDVQELQRLQAQTLEQTERAVRRFTKAAQARESQYDFAGALREYQAAAKWAKREVSAELWAQVQNRLGTMHRELGIRVEGEAAQRHLAFAVAAFREALTVYTKQALPQHWAMTQNNLGAALMDQASRTQGEASSALLALAVSAFRDSLTVYTKQALPQDWAMTQNNLGVALWNQASRTQVEAGTALLALAVSAYREALTIYTKQALPQHWAMTQNNLGVALWNQASRTQGEAGTALLGLAVSAYREALTIYTKQALPQHWAMTQNNLGVALWNQASRTQGEAGTALLGLAVSAFREALTIYTKQALPQHWAMTQNNLGFALRDQASRTQGEAGAALLDLAISAFREALTIYTKQALPQHWAMAQSNLGTALCDQASRLPADHPSRKDLLIQAIGVYRAALTLHTQAVFPIYWARAQMNLAVACALLPDERCAADGFAAVLQVVPDWAEGYNQASFRYHEKLFLFAQAHALIEQWLARQPDDLYVGTSFVETHLTTGRWAALPGQLAKVFPKLSPVKQVPLLAIELAALTVQNQTREAAERRKALRQLVSAQPAEFQISWTFAGTRHYLQTEPRFAPHKQKLLLLLSALEQRSRDAILAALDACCTDSATSS
jgi:tetratricopeptide (TPR) repeat protein